MLTLIIGPPGAIDIMTLSTIATNAYLSWAYRDAMGDTPFLWKMMIAGVFGAPIGVYFLTGPNPVILGVVLGVSMLVYVTLSFVTPDMTISDATASTRSSVPTGSRWPTSSAVGAMPSSWRPAISRP